LIKKNLLDTTVEEYNKYHGMEARVSILRQSFDGKVHLVAQFKGPFCFSCAPDEYYADFQILLQQITGLKFKINSIKQENNGAVVDFEYVEGESTVVYLSHF